MSENLIDTNTLNHILNFIIFVPLVLAILFIAYKGYEIMTNQQAKMAFLSLFFSFLMGIKNIFVGFFNVIKNNLYILFVFILLIVYLYLSFFVFKSGPTTETVIDKDGKFAGISTGNVTTPQKETFDKITNIMWIIVGIGLIISLFHFTTRDPTRPESNSFMANLSWLGKKLFSDVKIFTGFVIVLALALLSIYLVARFKFVNVGLALLVQVLAVIAVLFIAYRFVAKNSKLMRMIEKNTLLKFLYHLIFAIPCIIVDLVKGTVGNVSQTPKSVWVMFGIEIVLITLYFIIPVMKKWLVKTNIFSRSTRASKDLEVNTINETILSIENKIYYIKQKINLVDWKKIIKDKLYEKDDDLKSYLQGLGFKDYYESKGFMSALYNWALDLSPSMTLTEAISYVKANAPELINLDVGLKNELNDRKSKTDYNKNLDDEYTTKILLRKPVYLDKEKSLGSFENFKQDIHNYNYRYGLSAWVFLHQQPPSSGYKKNMFTSIINYGNNPNILYNASEGSLQITMNTERFKKKIIYETSSIPLQRWTNIVVNSDGGTLDVFIDGQLVSTKHNTVPFISNEAVTVGSDDGVSGGVCNIIYYSKPLSYKQLSLTYNLLKNKNPPIV